VHLYGDDLKKEEILEMNHEDVLLVPSNAIAPGCQQRSFIANLSTGFIRGLTHSTMPLRRSIDSGLMPSTSIAT